MTAPAPLCKCGCGRPLPPARGPARKKEYASNACRVRASTARKLEREARALAAAGPCLMFGPKAREHEPMRAVGFWLPSDLVQWMDEHNRLGSRSYIARQLLRYGRAVAERRGDPC